MKTIAQSTALMTRRLRKLIGSLTYTDPVSASLASTRRAAQALSERQALIPMEEVSDVRILDILQCSAFEARITVEGMIRGRTLAGMHFAIAILESNHLLQFWSCFHHDGNVDRETLLERAAEVNGTIMGARAAIDHECDLIMDTALSFHGGLLPSQLLHTLAVFERSAMEAARVVKR